MKISSTSQNIKFKGTPLYPVLLKKTNGSTESAIGMLIKLDAKDSEDIKLINKLKSSWEKWSSMIDNYCKKFLKSGENKTLDHYAIKLSDAEQDIAGVLTTVTYKSEKEKKLHLSYILTNPKLINERIQRPIKGVGEALLGHVFHKAEELKADYIDFTSCNNSFYFRTFEKAGIDLSEEMDYADILENHFVIGQPNFKKYIRYCEEKYGFKFPEMKTNQQT